MSNSKIPPISSQNAAQNGAIPPKITDHFDASFSQDGLAPLLHGFATQGDAFRIATTIGTTQDVYVFSHPEHVRHMLVDRHQNYVKGLGIERVGMLLGNGIIVSEGELWRRQRKMIQPAFHASILTAMTARIRDTNAQLLTQWTEDAKRETPVNLTQTMSEIALQIILQAIFGADLDRMTTSHGSNPFAILTEESERTLALAYKFRALSKIVIDCARQRTSSPSPSTPDFLDMLLAARDRKTNEAMSEKQLLDEIMTLIIAGHETSASSLNWMWYLLSQHPEIESKLHQEIDALEEDADITQIMRLSYTKQVIQETLRLYPPVWLLTRRAVDDDTINGYHIAAGTNIFIPPYIVHRHPQFWDDPETFDPDRFAPEKQHNRFAYLPFALGPRACIGEDFAILEMLIHTFILARRLRLKYLPQQPIELECQVNLRTKHPIMMQPELRVSQ